MMQSFDIDLNPRREDAADAWLFVCLQAHAPILSKGDCICQAYHTAYLTVCAGHTDQIDAFSKPQGRSNQIYCNADLDLDSIHLAEMVRFMIVAAGACLCYIARSGAGLARRQGSSAGAARGTVNDAGMIEGQVKIHACSCKLQIWLNA